MNKTIKLFFTKVLEWQVRRLRTRHTFKTIGVVGSVGKTSTKIAIAKLLSNKFSVRFQDGNYNEPLSVPLVFFGHTIPSKKELFKWLTIFISNEKQIFSSYRYDIVVVELGTDGPGQIAAFGSYIKLDLAVITAISPEHMEYFKTIEAVAAEELSVSAFSKHLLVNKDLCPEKYLHSVFVPVSYYAQSQTATFEITKVKQEGDFFEFELFKNGVFLLRSRFEAISIIQLYSACAAAAVGNTLGMSSKDLDSHLRTIAPVHGRMQKLKGVNNSIIIDDTYNASPDAVIAALQTLHMTPAPYKIAILGMMNELGVTSAAQHKKIGQYCDPKKINLVVTIGTDANMYTAEEAIKKGCVVYRAKHARDAGQYIINKIVVGTLILAKGSQNNVFAEEAIKYLLADSKDQSKLVRQNREWLEKKQALFK